MMIVFETKNRKRDMAAGLLLAVILYLLLFYGSSEGSVRISFLGGTREVGGSCQMVDTGRSLFLVDCGALGDAGRDVLPEEPGALSYVILTHAHTDHCGLLPELFEAGFSGKVYCTPATAKVIPVILRMARSFSRDKVSKESFDLALGSIVPVQFGDELILDEVRVVFRRAGHLLGAAFIEIDVQDGVDSTRIVFSGDVGSGGSVLLRGLDPCHQADWVIIESTYGGKVREPVSDDPFERHSTFINAVGDALMRGGDVLIPAFTLGRTQEITAALHLGLHHGVIPAGTLIYSDSPTAKKITSIYKESRLEFSEYVLDLFGDRFLSPSGLREVKSATSIKVHARNHEPSIFISSSGDLNFANSPRHLMRMFDRDENLLCMVGWQSPGSVGRRLARGETPVLVRHREGRKLEKDWINPAIEILRVVSFSSHADQDQLVSWLSSIESVDGVFIVHGEMNSSELLRGRIIDELGIVTKIPRPGESFDCGSDGQRKDP
jgi:metallo-beta-lactamase family protein